jgi:hypothetical protein
MGVYCRDDLKRRWPVVVCADPYTSAEWDQALTAILTHPGAAPPNLRLLIDARYCAAVGEIVRRLERLVSRRPAESTRIAVVMGRMNSAVPPDGEGSWFRLFREWRDAESWLGRP